MDTGQVHDSWWAFGPIVLDQIFGDSRCIDVSVCYEDHPPTVAEVRKGLRLSPAQTVSVSHARPMPVSNIDTLRLTPGRSVVSATGEGIGTVSEYPLTLVEYDLTAPDVIRLKGLLRAYVGLNPSDLLRDRLDSDMAHLLSVRGSFTTLDYEFEKWRGTVR